MGHQEIARNDSAGRAIQSEGSLGSGPVVPGPRGAGHLLRSAGITAGPAVPGRGFREFYCPDNGRDSVPPSLLATALLLQSHDKVSDAEAKARADFDLRWTWCAGSFPTRRSLQGYLKKRSMRVALDTTNILGRGAVRDTFNLLADGSRPSPTYTWWTTAGCWPTWATKWRP